MYLAAIADAQPQAPPMPPQVVFYLVNLLNDYLFPAYILTKWHLQMAPHPVMQQGGYFMQHPQAAAAAAMAQQPGLFPSKVPLQFGSPHQLQDPQQQLHQQHQQAIQGQMGMRPVGPSNGLHSMNTETTLGGVSTGGPHPSSGPSDARGGSKQDASDTTGAGGQGNTAAGHQGGDGESSLMKGSEEAK